MVNNFLNYGIRTFSLFLKTCTPIICAEKVYLDGTMKLVMNYILSLKMKKKKKKTRPTLSHADGAYLEVCQ